MSHLPVVCRNCWGRIKTSQQVPHCPLCRMGNREEIIPQQTRTRTRTSTHPPPIAAWVHQDVQQGYRSNPEPKCRFMKKIAKLMTVDRDPFYFYCVWEESLRILTDCTCACFRDEIYGEIQFNPCILISCAPCIVFGTGAGLLGCTGLLTVGYGPSLCCCCCNCFCMACQQCRTSRNINV
eukprot:UN12727